MIVQLIIIFIIGIIVGLIISKNWDPPEIIKDIYNIKDGENEDSIRRNAILKLQNELYDSKNLKIIKLSDKSLIIKLKLIK